ncbi:MAG TPA: hypothetical protein VIK92_07960 [Thermaerobacter sp.]
MLREPETYSYTYPVDALGPGSSLGNPLVFVRLDARSDVAGVWGVEHQYYLGLWRCRVYVDGRPLQPRTTRFAAAYQLTQHATDDVTVDQVVFVPYDTEPLRSVFLALVGRNLADEPVELEVEFDLRFPAVSHPDFIKEPDPEQREKPVQIWQEDRLLIARTRPVPFYRASRANPNEVRILQSPVTPERVWLGAPGRARLWFRLPLAGAERREWVWQLSFSPFGEDDARAALDADPVRVFAETRAGLARRLARLRAILPEPALERAVYWAKVNTLRVQHQYPAGWGFTNDPPQDIVVVRDVAWYSMGSDWFTPDFSRAMQELVLQYGTEPSGKFTEYLRASHVPPSRDDYGLTLNDDTPLFILAVVHHLKATGDRGYLQNVYPIVRRAAEAILACERDGLIYVDAPGTNVWGIASWRNIIQGYRLTGAVTEIQAECAAALRAMAEAADAVGDREGADRFAAAADRLIRALDEQLADRARGRYLLYRAPGGEALADETADQVFPLLFGVASPEMAERVGRRLLSPTYWTPHGCRTVPRDDPSYDPDFGLQLMGGVWPNLTAWVAYATRHLQPDIVAEALRRIWTMSEVERPRDHGHVCPGQFPERLDGERPISRGMALSPWMPPTYLWLVVEGLFGLSPSWSGTLRVDPALPRNWRWAALRDLPYHGRSVTLVLHEGRIYSTADVESSWPVERFEEDLSHLLPRDVPAVLLRRPGEVLLWIASHEDRDLHLELPDLGPDVPRELSLHLPSGEASLYRFPAA